MLPATASAGTWRAAYRAVRATTEALTAPLEIEDLVLQSMPEASPLRWHLAHTTWFFETFVLAAQQADHRPFAPEFGYLFNSYYDNVGPRVSRPRRGLLTRPTVREVRAYRRHVDEALLQLPDDLAPAAAAVVELGLHHEQQHQELMLTDLKHLLSLNPTPPVYAARPDVPAATTAPPAGWWTHPGGVVAIGHGGAGFAFDNEGPRHRVLLAPFAVATRPVTCGEYLEFVAAGGYAEPRLWLSDGWDARCQGAWQAPLYWRGEDGSWRLFTLAGELPLEPAEPVCHLSYYEADAYARWRGLRLPTESEWEAVAAGLPVRGHFADRGRFQPAAAPAGGEAGPQQVFGDVWEWTASAYAAYPGYAPPAGALGEYNAKFMCNQLVLRGGSCATPAGHVRPTYRNFFPPTARWQFSGLRLARDEARR
jgi:ergothioneine biosynthesis protein EgtB